MGNNIANIATTPVNVYLGPTGSDITDLASWHCLGWCKAGQTKMSTSDVRQIKTARGLTLELASKYQFRAEALETTRAQLLELENLKNRKVDILLHNWRDGVTIYLLQRFALHFREEYVYSMTAPRKIIIEAYRTAKNFTDVYLVGSLGAAATQEGVDLYGGTPHLDPGGIIP